MYSDLLDDDEKAKLDQLKALIDFGQANFTNLKIAWPRTKRRKRTMLRMVTAIHSHTLSGYILLSSAQTHSAEILLRPILETLINMEYILCGKNNMTLNRFLTMGNTELARKMNGMIQYIQNNPDVKTSMTVQNLQDGIDSRNDENTKFAKQFKYQIQTADISLYDRTVAIDKEFKRLKGKPAKFSKQWRYFTEYTLLSDSVHLGSRGLHDYMIDSPTRVDLVFGGRKDRVIPTIDGFYVHYIDMLRIFNSQFGQPALKDIKGFEKSYKLG